MREMTGDDTRHAVDRDDLVWQFIDELHDSRTVRQTRRYMAGRERLKVARRTLVEWIRPKRAIAGLITAAMLVFFVTYSLSQPFERAGFATAIGQMKRVQLSDGSEVTLDTDSAISVSFGEEERRVQLLKGRASFSVAHDVVRPFKVFSSGMMVTAVGTEFVVSLASNKNVVTLLEGKVAVDTPRGTEFRLVQHRILQPGQQMMVRSDGRAKIHQLRDISAATAWRDSRMEFSGTSAADAIAEANRYSTQKIRLADPRDGARLIGGSFQTGQQEALARAVCALLKLNVIRRSDRELVLG